MTDITRDVSEALHNGVRDARAWWLFGFLFLCIQETANGTRVAGIGIKVGHLSIALSFTMGEL